MSLCNRKHNWSRPWTRPVQRRNSLYSSAPIALTNADKQLICCASLMQTWIITCSSVFTVTHATLNKYKDKSVYQNKEKNIYMGIQMNYYTINSKTCPHTSKCLMISAQCWLMLFFLYFLLFPWLESAASLQPSVDLQTISSTVPRYTSVCTCLYVCRLVCFLGFEYCTVVFVCNRGWWLQHLTLSEE